MASGSSLLQSIGSAVSAALRSQAFQNPGINRVSFKIGQPLGAVASMCAIALRPASVVRRCGLDFSPFNLNGLRIGGEIESRGSRPAQVIILHFTHLVCATAHMLPLSH